MNDYLGVARLRTWNLAAAALVVTVAAIVGLTGLLPVPRIIWSDEGASAPDQYLPSFSTPHEHDVLLVYIGSSTCGFANNPELPDVIERAKVALQQDAADAGFSFSAIGVSIDWDPARGYAHLAKMGHFDEIMTGRRLWGVGTSAWQEFIIGTPQVLVVRQTANEQRLPVASDNVVVLKAGFGPISDWVDAGAPLP